MRYRNCKVCGDIPLEKKISICGGCMDRRPEFIDNDKYFVPLEVKRFRARRMKVMIVIFSGTMLGLFLINLIVKSL